MNNFLKPVLFLAFFGLTSTLISQEKFEVMDVFDLKYVTSVEISPDGKKVAYLVNFKDIMTDKSYSNLWIMNVDGSDKQQITKGNFRDSGPSWSRAGDKLAYKSNKDGKTKIYIRDVQGNTERAISDTQESPGSLTWSPDDSQLAFDMFVAVPLEKFYTLPEKPEGAEWNAPPVYIDILPYRFDGAGYIRSGKKQLFTISTEGGEAKQITNDKFDHSAPVWSPDGKSLYGHGLIRENGTDKPFNNDIYRVDLSDGKFTPITDRIGPDQNPKFSNNGKLIAYRGFDDKRLSYQAYHLYLMNADGTEPRLFKLPSDFDRSISGFEWSSNDQGLYIIYEDHGVLQLSYVDMDGQLTELANNIGGSFMARPYTDSGGFSLANNGAYAFEFGSAAHPPEVGVGKDGKNQKLTEVNSAFFAKKKIGEVEEVWLKSRHDQLDIQAWIVKPSDFDPGKQYPLVLQIHGGPHASYGPYFSVDYQTYAASGNVVLYVNPRGSTGYGEGFTQEINFDFPSHDYDDLMTAVGYMRDQPYIDKGNVFVTGGSGGGILTAWITTKSQWFRAAAVIKPVINWYSFALYSDLPQRFSYWFPKYPWEDPMHYLNHSPIQFVDKVKTPSLLVTGEIDYRTPMADTEQYYGALKLLGVETAMVRIPNAFHGIDARGSGTVARLTAIQAWFDKYSDKTPTNFNYQEKDEVPGETMEEKVKHLSQIDKLSKTQSDFARCSASSLLNAFLVMDGDWRSLAQKYNIGSQLTFESAHLLQDALFLEADKDGEGGVFGAFRPQWDKKERLTGWDVPAEAELPGLLEQFGFEYDPFIGPTKEKEHYKKDRVEKFFKENPNGAILMGVHEDMETWSSKPIDEGAPGNHYIICYKRGDDYHFVDSWRKPGAYGNGVFSKEEVESMLFNTKNLLVGLTLNGSN